MVLEADVLRARHGVNPCNPRRMLLLVTRFPGAIRLFTARLEGRLLAGVLIYASSRVAHAQYMAASPEGAACGALDGVVAHVLDVAYPDIAFVDFGISTERDGTHLNEGLIGYKESCGARGIAYDTYELDLAASGAA